MNAITVFSAFDGAGIGMLALKRAGIPVSKYYASEVDKYAMQIAKKNHPEIEEVGDVKNCYARNFPKIDLLIGGSPCQDLSIAKANREGLKGARSGLFWHFIRLLRTMKPKYFLLENVASMSKEDKAKITEIIGVDPILINSALVSAQQRKRLYWTNIPGITQPEDKGILLKDILVSGYVSQEKSYVITATEHKGTTLRDNLEKHRRTIVAEPLRIPENTVKGYTKINQGDCVDLTQMSSKTRRGRNMKYKSNCLTAGECQFYQYVEPIRIGELDGLGKGQANGIYSVQGKSVCLNASGGGGGAKTGLYKIDLPDGDYIIRKLTPVECERLQTWPDNYTEGVSNTQRYKMIGNGWTVDVIAHIFSFIQKEG